MNKLQYQIAPIMEICEGGQNIHEDLDRLSLQPRQTGLLDFVNMPWNSSEATISKEFNNLYLSRLDQLSCAFSHQQITPIAKISDKSICTIRGVFKRIESQRVRAFEKTFHQKYDNDKPIYSENDELEIEDKTGKIKFRISQKTTHNIPNCGVLQKSDLPNGVVIVITGQFHKHANLFRAKHIALPNIRPQSNFQYNYRNGDGVNFLHKKILIASEPTVQMQGKIKMMLTNVCNSAVNICAVVIIGGMNMTVEAITQMSEFVKSIQDTVDVFIMPSSGIDRNKLFPLRPYSEFFFLQSQQDLGLCSNPQNFQAQNGLKIHISCGQNVKDFMKNTSLPKDQLQAMELMLLFGHFCPTSPFSLKTEPYLRDYLVVDELPHVMICGKSQTYSSKRVAFGDKEVLLVAVPANGMGMVGLDGFYCKQLQGY